MATQNRTRNPTARRTEVRGLAERALLAQALERLRDYGVPLTVTIEPTVNAQRLDAIVTVTAGKQAIRHAVKAKRHLTPETLGTALAQLDHYDGPKLLVADYITPPLGAKLRARGVAYVDTVGNAFLHQPPVHVWVDGCKPEAPAAYQRPTRVFHPAGLRLTFALLCKPELAAAPVRTFAAAGNVALGTVVRFLDDFRAAGYLAVLGRKRMLRRRRELLDRWTDAYAAVLRPKLQPKRFLATNRNWWKTAKLDVAVALLGGEPAANRLTGYLKPEKTTIYVRQGIAPLLGLGPFLPARDEWDTEFLPIFWNFDDALEKKGTVPGPLVYADLMATGDDRCIETAKRIYDEHLAAKLGHD
jgi:hypothetical protein